MKPHPALPLIVLLALWPAGTNATAEDKAIAFFESKIRPVLVQHCYKCHASDAKSVKGGLLLDTKAGLLAGGESGAAVIPKNTEESLLLNALRYEDYEMPPSGQLSEAVIADFEKWIAMGAPDPRESDQAIIRREIDLEAGRNYWAFKPVANREPPTANDDWPTHDIDRFVYAKLSEKNLRPVGDADPATWYRRVKFDIVGLPPTTKELASFQAAAAKDPVTAKQEAVDELLASGHFGERWARHWLDLARYAESTGRTRNYPFPFAWRYRDYVIRSFNEDKPFDQFIVEQIAGDLLPSNDVQTRESQLTATGFLAIGSPDLNERNAKIYKMDLVADQIDTMSRSMLGLTVGCAQCHDHKFDPIPTEDYYALAGIFTSTDLLNGYAARQGGKNKARGDLLIKLGAATQSEVVEGAMSPGEIKAQEKIDRAKEAKDKANKALNQIKRNKSLSKKQRAQKLAQAKRELGRKTRELNQLRRKSGGKEVKFRGPACLGVRDSKEIANCKVHVRGDVTNLGHEVERGFLQVISGQVGLERESLTIAKDESGRLQLAQWIASPNNPLTARVFVNRVWRHLFGQGIVQTVDNFGEMGARPTHPELLDHLASQFVENGWSVKQLIRELVLSRTYGLSVDDDPQNAQIDEHNDLLWRMNPRRLDFEVLRDTLLATAGKLELSPPTGSFVESVKVAEISRQKTMFEFDTFRHRSIYLPVLRNLTPDAMSYFDFPDPSETRGARDATNVPTQSLYLLNSPFVVGMARATAKSLLKSHPTGKVDEAYKRIFGREATDDELAKVENYIATRIAELEQRDEPKGKGSKERRRVEIAWSEAVHAMFASAEFRYR